MREYLYQKLVALLKQDIASGRWQENEKLPSIRQLSEEHKLAKITVQHALHKLEAQRIVVAKNRSGYYVANTSNKNKAVESNTQIRSPRHINMPDLFYQVMSYSAAFDVYPSAPASHSHSPHIALLNRSIARAYREHNHHNSQYYASPKGAVQLRQQLSESYHQRGFHSDAENFCITAGCQNSLFIALMSTCQPGDTVAIESPGFYGVLQLLKQLNLNAVELPVSYTQGLKAQQLEKAAAKWPIKACIVTPNFATPTGAMMPEEQKQQLVLSAEQLNITLIEDDIYADLGFHSTPKPLIAYTSSSPIILCSSWSKSLSRDLRLGWITTNKDIEPLVQNKLVNHLAESQNSQKGMIDFIAEGHYSRHLSHFKQHLLKQRDQLITTLNTHWQTDCRYTVPDGGLALWLQLPAHIDTLVLYKQAIKENIVITPGRLFTNSNEFTNYLRLPFAQSIDKPRSQALLRLGQLIEQCR